MQKVFLSLERAVRFAERNPDQNLNFETGFLGTKPTKEQIEAQSGIKLPANLSLRFRDAGKNLTKKQIQDTLDAGGLSYDKNCMGAVWAV